MKQSPVNPFEIALGPSPRENEPGRKVSVQSAAVTTASLVMKSRRVCASVCCNCPMVSVSSDKKVESKAAANPATLSDL